jgi:hypothetical protein
MSIAEKEVEIMAVNWIDRVPTRANRVLVTPENGGTPYYATITRADEPSVVGTPVNAANLNAMQAAAGLTANKSVYVAATGSDTTGDGSATAPYATISKALSTIPKNLNGFDATIFVAAGTYPSGAYIRGFGNGCIRISGAVGDVVTLSAIEIVFSQIVEITNISVDTPGSPLSLTRSTLRMLSPFSSSGAQYGVYANYESSALFMSDITVNNLSSALSGAAVAATNCSNVYVENLLGNNVISFTATRGSVCSYGSDNSTSTAAKYYTDKGGRIYSGAQTNTPVN